MPYNISLIQQRTEAIERNSDLIGALVEKAATRLSRDIRTGFVNKLQLDKTGAILNNLYNKKLVAQIDGIYSTFAAREGAKIVKAVLGAVDELQDLSEQYYTGFGTPERIAEIKATAKSSIYDLLGVSEEGKILKDGYFDTMLKNPVVKEKIKNQAKRAIIGKQPQEKYIDNADTFLSGDLTKNKKGVFKDFYESTANDIVATTDRITGEFYADSLGLVFAIYEGNIIKTTRPFCRQRAGKVFHKTEIAKFDPPTAKPPGYNPFFDLGGYNCRHHLNWISEKQAIRMRPDAKQFLNEAA